MHIYSHIVFAPSFKQYHTYVCVFVCGRGVEWHNVVVRKQHTYHTFLSHSFTCFFSYLEKSRCRAEHTMREAHELECIELVRYASNCHQHPNTYPTLIHRNGISFVKPLFEVLHCSYSFIYFSNKMRNRRTRPNCDRHIRIHIFAFI